MDKIEELLPGIEEFLTSILASEALSSFAEDRRQFFLERIDVIKLPPSIPPREGRILPPDLLEESEKSSGTLVNQHLPDFAATQRAISRSFLESNPSHVIDPICPSLNQEIKVYDDIDQADSKHEAVHSSQRSAPDSNRSYVADSTDGKSDEHDLYEVPVTIQQSSAEDTSPSHGTDGSSFATTGSTEELPSWEITSATSSHILCPLPPKTDMKAPGTGSQESIKGGDQPPELPFRPPLPKRSEIYARSDRSEMSDTDEEPSGDGDSTSYESFDDDDDDQPSADTANKFDVQLPKKLKKKSQLKRSRKLGKSRSSSEWEITVPFRKLENVEISGELFYRGKRKWNRRLGAISNGYLAVYKLEKNARPSLVIPLAGHEVTFSEREGKKGYEVKLVNPDGDSHAFSLDYKEWAVLWMEHITGNSKGKPPPKYHTHLARSFSESSDYGQCTATDGHKNDLKRSTSNESTEKGSEENSKNKIKRNKLKRMGSFASRASHFFGNIGKKSSERKKSHHHSHTPAPCLLQLGGETAYLTNGNMESSVSSTNSTGNLAKELSPASDSSLTSVFGHNPSGTSPPATPNYILSPMRTFVGQIGDNLDDITCKGNLLVFSSFNKRCWGRRWCLVRQNMFQCYRTDHSQQYELSFLLKPCVLRRAQAETNSELGLMILEAGKEKITVEILSKDEMSQWVEVLLRETSTENVPEGLEQFLKQPWVAEDYGSNEVNSFYPSSNLSSHEYEDPEETIAAAAKLAASCSNNTCSAPFPSKADQDESPGVSQRVPSSSNLTADSLPEISKHITDSGFYSVRGNNSDSDNSCEDISDARRKDLRFTTVSSQSFNNSQNSGSSSVEICGSSRKRGTMQQGSETSSKENHSHHIVSSSSSTAYQSIPASQPSTRSKHLAHSASKPASSQPGSHIPSYAYHFSGQTKVTSLSKSSKKVNLAKRTSNSTSPASKSGSSTSSHKTVISPSGEEYSVILKRSERVSKSHTSEATLHDTLSSTTYLKSKTREAFEDGVFHGANRMNKFTDEQINLIANSDTKQSAFYKAVNVQSSLETQSSMTMMQSTETNSGNNISHDFLTDTDINQPPELPRSPIPHLNTDRIEVTMPSTPDSRKVGKDDQSFITYVHKKSETRPARDEAAVVNMEEKERKMMITSEGDDPISPTSDIITALIGEKTTTPDDLKQMIDSLKCKQAETKRKRMAVHDKRQRVSSDEERLACEKEFAALEKIGETTDQNIRILQNHLNTLEGQTMEAMKAAQGQQKLGPKKKTHKRVQPWR